MIEIKRERLEVYHLNQVKNEKNEEKKITIKHSQWLVITEIINRKKIIQNDNN